MKIIWKYPLMRVDTQEITIPENSRILSVKLQNDCICMWAYVETTSRMIQRRIHIYGTGNVADSAMYLEFIDTVIDGPFVWHVYAEMGK